MNEIEAFVEELSQMHFKFSLICFQECWLSDNDDKSHLQIDGYDCITQGKHAEIKVVWSCTLTIVLITR